MPSWNRRFTGSSDGGRYCRQRSLSNWRQITATSGHCRLLHAGQNFDGTGTRNTSYNQRPCALHSTHYSRHTHPFNGPFSGTTQLSRYQKSKTNLDFTEARDSELQWHQLGRTQVCTSLQTDNRASTPLLSFFTGRMPFLTPNQQRQGTEGTDNTNTSSLNFLYARCCSRSPTSCVRALQ